ncbi:DNA-binding response regulator [Sphaerisporangium rufum]|uniref:DNA-binding response regulator n=1 Tax=Sphaerisporangium rufum TaxID=1381558 RepID=A0A919QYC1_9ACTN|nr:response regulator transcription factor [Sphaerisporangium rufum]GII76324.1 DNA-binding response regulator [Sphaerisporangium rufum]
MTGAAAIRVLVVDDQQIVREGLVALLGLMDGVEVAGAAGDGEGALRLLAETSADVVLMDLRMPVMDGVAATRHIARRHPKVAVLVLTTYADDDSIADALRSGARGYLTKDAGRAEIAAALRATASGQSTFSGAVSRRLVAAMLRPDPRHPVPPERWGNPDGLTPREAEILKLIAGGMSNQQIAGALFIGESTVKTHINHAFAKIGARGRSDATRYVYRHGLAEA